jgi:hypothetical protein
MRSLVIVSMLLASLMSASTAQAQDPPISRIPPGEDVITVVRKGDPAPYTGQLFDPSTAIRWGNALEQYKVRLKIDIEAVESTCTVEKDYRDKLLATEKTHASEVLRLHQVELEAARKRAQALEAELDNPPWYRTVGFGAALGGAAALGAVILGVVIVNSGS